jgi:hypothetical protein
MVPGGVLLRAYRIFLLFHAPKDAVFNEKPIQITLDFPYEK